MYRNNKKIIMSKLFPLPPNKNYDNLMIDDDAVTYITTPSNSELITAIIDSHIPEYIFRSDISLLDGTACVGGDSIAFGKIFGTVISVEIDQSRYEMLTNNLFEYELFNVVPINMDCLEIYQKLNFIDIMYFDPPWGGKKYRHQNNLRLTIGDIYVDELVDNIFTPNKIRSDVKMVVLKLPKNYDLLYLYNKIKHHKLDIFMYELNKMIIIVIKKTNAWKKLN